MDTKTSCTLFAAVLASVLLVSPVSAQGPTIIGSEFECGQDPENLKFWLIVENTSGLCTEPTPGYFECTNLDGGESRADCESGCSLIAGQAGCISAQYIQWAAIQHLPGGLPVTPHFSVECDAIPEGEPNGPRPRKVYDLKPGSGKNSMCEQLTDNANVVTGGQCTHTEQDENNVLLVIDTKVDCDSGCLVERPPAECKQRGPTP